MMPGPVARPPEERFWPKVRKTAGCWLWTGAKNSLGYGRFLWRGNELVQAHRAALLLDGVDLPPHMNVCHACDNPSCVRRSHLFIGTQQENIRDMTRKGRRRDAVGESASTAKLTAGDVVEMRRMYASGIGYRRLGAVFGLNPATVRSAVLCLTWRHVG